MGAGFLVQNTMQSTTSGDSEMRLICRALKGFLTSRNPSRTRFKNQSL